MPKTVKSYLRAKKNLEISKFGLTRPPSLDNVKNIEIKKCLKFTQMQIAKEEYPYNLVKCK